MYLPSYLPTFLLTYLPIHLCKLHLMYLNVESIKDKYIAGIVTQELGISFKINLSFKLFIFSLFQVRFFKRCKRICDKNQIWFISRKSLSILSKKSSFSVTYFFKKVTEESEIVPKINKQFKKK